MGMTLAQFKADLAAIFSDLASSGAVQTATFYAANGTTSRGTASVIRGVLSSTQRPADSGWAKLYKCSWWVEAANIPAGVAIDDVVSDGTACRILNIESDGAGIYKRLDLGDPTSGGL